MTWRGLWGLFASNNDIGSSVEFVGELRLMELSKCMI